MRSVIATVILIGMTVAASAQTGPMLVIPGRPGVPVLINGRDASYSVVEGDWGLANRIHVQPVVLGSGSPYVQPDVGHYYPSAGRLPGYGRLEIIPPANRSLPPPAENFYQSWSAQSGPPHVDPPLNPPPVIVAPQFNGPPRDVPRRY